MTVPPNVEYEDVFVRAAARAREAGRGLWGRGGCADA
jgi:endonuclease YncB( thermonuclease family)